METILFIAAMYVLLPTVLVLVSRQKLEARRPRELMRLFREELGGSIREELEKYYLEDYELGPILASLIMWFDEPDTTTHRLNWVVSCKSDAFLDFSVGPLTSKSTGLAKRGELKALEPLEDRSGHESWLCCATPEFKCNLVLIHFIDWFFTGKSRTSAAYKRFLAAGFVNQRLSIDRGELVFEGNFTSKNRDRQELISYLEMHFNLINGVVKSAYHICHGYEPTAFLRKRLEFVEFQKLVGPSQAHHKALLELEDPEQREARKLYLLHEADPRISLGVLQHEDLWIERSRELSEGRLLEVLSVLCEQERVTPMSMPDLGEQPSARASAILIGEGHRRFALEDLPRLAKRHDKVAHGLFLLFHRWREEGTSEEELCELLVESWRSFNQKQARLGLAALRVNDIRDPLVHPAHLGVLELVHLSEWDAGTLRLFVNHTDALVDLGVAWMSSKPLVEKLVWVILHGSLIMTRKQVIAIFEKHGDARLLPFLIPHRDESKEIAALINRFKSSDSFAASRGQITLTEPDEKGALTITKQASAGDLTAAKEDEG